MDEHWHFYCDEAGNFETIKRKKGEIIGLLVADSERRSSSDKFESLAETHGLQVKTLHGYYLHREPSYIAFKEAVVELTLQSHMRIVRVRYGTDVRGRFPKEVSEAFVCNRYLYMIQSLLEHVLFLCPSDFGKTISFSVKPNSRVFPCSNEAVPEISNLGFKCFRPPGAANYFVKVWDKAGLRIFLSRLRLDYLHRSKITGFRNFPLIEMPVADKSSDVFVKWVDIIAGHLMWQKDTDSSKRLVDRLYVDATYSVEDQAYRNLCLLLLDGRFKPFITQYLSTIHSFTNDYYRKQLGLLFNQKLAAQAVFHLDELLELEALADACLRNSLGNWRYIESLVTMILKWIGLLPEEVNDSPAARTLKFRLNNHMLSCHNHRGEVGRAWEAVERIDALNLQFNTIEEWRGWVEYKNRRAVTAANMFAFAKGNEELEGIKHCLEVSLTHINSCTGLKLQDKHLGKLHGTIAQNLAFLAPRRPELFPQAEKMFLDAKTQFDRPADLLRQNIYLAHLYMDWKEPKKLLQVWFEIGNDNSVKTFFKMANQDSARSMQFVLALQLKLCLLLPKMSYGMLTKYSKQALDACFSEASSEHPFEFVYSYLAQLAYAEGDRRTGDEYFDRSLMIPSRRPGSLQVTIETIRSQNLVRWALCLVKTAQDDRSTEKVHQALAIMENIASDPVNRSVLRLEDSRPVEGWFASGYQALKSAVADGKLENDQLEKFLSCFTFNYW